MNNLSVQRRDLRIELRLKNNQLWQAIHRQYKSINQFCLVMQMQGFKLNYSTIIQLMNFRLSPFNKAGLYRKNCVDLSSALGVSVEELFPASLHEQVGLQTSIHVREVDSQTSQLMSAKAMLALPAAEKDSPLSTLLTAERQAAVTECLGRLPPRYRAVLELCYGLSGDEHTAKEIGKVLEITASRVWEIKGRALKRLARLMERRQLNNPIE